MPGVASGWEDAAAARLDQDRPAIESPRAGCPRIPVSPATSNLRQYSSEQNQSGISSSGSSSLGGGSTGCARRSPHNKRWRVKKTPPLPPRVEKSYQNA